MYIINSYVLNTINTFRNNLDTFMMGYINQVSTQFNFNLFQTPNNYLYSIISENVRMDMNYLSALNPDFDIFGFPGVNRNVRNSIEAYLDLYNLTFDEKYICVLKYISRNATTTSDEYKIVQEYANKLDLKKKGKYYNFSILSKRMLAEKNNIHQDILNTFLPYIRDANAYVHPDIFVKCPDKEKRLENLCNIDCLLLAYSFELLTIWIQNRYNYFPMFNIRAEYNNCINYLNSYTGSYIRPL